MGIYSPELEKKLTKAPVLSNPLFKYDNYTYHIQLYLVDKRNFEDYNKERFKTFNYSITGALDTSTEDSISAYDKYLKNNKIIIAESGVTDDVSIKELIIKSNPAFGNEKCYCASSEMKLILVETAGNGLVNKMHLATSILGFNSYIDTPVYVSVWFTGYNNANKGIAEANIIENMNEQPVFTYQTVIEDVSTSVNLESTTYEMTLRPITDIGLKDLYAYSNNMQFDPWPRGCPFKMIMNKLQNIKNVEIQKALGEAYTDIYPNDDAVTIEIIDKIPNNEQYKNTLTEDSSSLEDDIDFLNEWLEQMKIERDIRNNTKRSERENNPTYKAARTFYNQNKDRAQNLVDKYGTRQWDRLWLDNGYAMFDEYVIAARDNLMKYAYTLNKDAIENHIDGYWPGGSYNSNQNSNLYTIIQDIWQICAPKSGIIPAINIVPEYVEDYSNKSFYKIKVYITFQIYPGLKELVAGIENKDYFLNVEQYQNDYFDYCYAHDCILKRYEYLLNGRDTSVISYDTKEDMFWYLNAGNMAEFAAKMNTRSANMDAMNELFGINYQEIEFRDYIINLVRSRIDALKAVNKKDIVTINDLVSFIDPESLPEIRMAFYRAALLNDIKYTLQTMYTENGENKENQSAEGQSELNADIKIAQLAAQNMLGHGQKLELNLKIIGDPYWLSFTPENLQLGYQSTPHLIMCIKTFSKNDSMDEPKEDKSMEINVLYHITDITSTFSDGQFTQDLHGYVPVPFVQQYIPQYSQFKEEQGAYGAVLVPDNGPARDVLVTKDGNVLNTGNLGPGEGYTLYVDNYDKMMTEKRRVENPALVPMSNDETKMSEIKKVYSDPDAKMSRISDIDKQYPWRK